MRNRRNKNKIEKEWDNVERDEKSPLSRKILPIYSTTN